MQVARKLSGSEGATTTTDGMMGLERDVGGGSRTTFLAKREGWFLGSSDNYFCI
jgi:hypothetical protein